MVLGRAYFCPLEDYEQRPGFETGRVGSIDGLDFISADLDLGPKNIEANNLHARVFEGNWKPESSFFHFGFCFFGFVPYSFTFVIMWGPSVIDDERGNL